jgi:hypothetical protein
MGVADVVAVLRADTSQFTAELGKATAEMDKLGNGGSSNFEKLSAMAPVAGLAIVAGLGGIDLPDHKQSAEGYRSDG